MNLKHISVVALLGASLSMPALAHEFTLGGGLASDKLDTEFKHTTTAAAKIFSSASDTELGGEAFIGYVWQINSGFDMAFEFFYDFMDVTTKEANGTSGHYKNNINNIMGVRALPGFRITNNTKLFLDLGYVNLENEIDIKDAGASGFTSTTKSTNVSGYRYGAGVQTKIYDNISLRVGYSVMDGFSAVKVSNTAGTESFSATPTLHVFNASVAWHFTV